MAPSYLANVYARHARAEDYAVNFINEHGLGDCYAASEITSKLQKIDHLLLVDKALGFVNWVTTEYVCRRAYGLESAFKHCRSKSDWNKSTAAAGKT